MQEQYLGVARIPGPLGRFPASLGRRLPGPLGNQLWDTDAAKAKTIPLAPADFRHDFQAILWLP